MNSEPRIAYLCSLLLGAIFIGGASILAQSPPNDNLASPTDLGHTTNVTVAGTTVGATVEPREPAHAGYPAAHSIWFKWTAPGDGSTRIDLSGSTNGTLLAVYEGKYMDSLTLVASNASGNPDGTGNTVFQVIERAVYDIAVDVSAAPGPVALNLQFTESCFPPQITQQPTSQTVLEGDTANFKVVATSDCPPSYQWLDNRGNAIPWGTSSVLSLTSVLPSQAGTNLVVVSNAGGSVTSSPAILVVNVPPSNDNFANRIPLSGNAATTSGSNVFATIENGEPNPASWSSPQSVWWTWTAPTNGLAFVDVTNYVGEQVLTIYTGNSLTQLTVVASVPWLTTPLAVQFDVSGGTIYQITVAGVEGAAGAFQLDLSFLATNKPPVIVQQPTSQTVLQGTTVTNQVVATSGLPLSYQWELNGSPIAGATNASLVLTNVGPGQAGSNRVVVSNAAGSVLSSNAILVVNVPPSNDNFTNASAILEIDVTSPGDNQFATSEPGEPNHGGYPPGASVWWTWTTPSIGDATVAVTNYSGAETLAIYAGTNLSQLSVVASNTWAVGGPLSVHFAATNGTVYEIAVADPNNIGGSFQLHTSLELSNFPPVILQQPPPQTNVIASTVTTFQWFVTNDFPVTNVYFLVRNGGNPEPIGGWGGGGGGGGGWGGGGGSGGGGGWDLTFTFTNVLTLTNVTIQTNEYYTVVTAFGGSVTSAPTYVIIHSPPSNDNFTNAVALPGTNPTAFGTTAYATLENGEPAYSGLTSGGSVWWTWTAPGAGTATISVTGTSTANQILQIFTGGTITNLLPVARSALGPNGLSVSFVTTASTTYQIAVVGGDAQFQLQLQFLSAAIPPVITQQPVDLTVPVGGRASFYVRAVGGGVLTYQWQFQGTNVLGATGDTLAWSGVSTNQAGTNYHVIVSTLGGSVPSRDATLNVTLHPTNDNFADSIRLDGTNATTTASNEYATAEPKEPSFDNWPAGNSVWWKWLAPADGRLQVTVSNYFPGEQIMLVYTGDSLDGLSLVAGTTWLQHWKGLPLISLFNVTSNTTYHISVEGEENTGSPFELDLAFTNVIFPPVIIKQPSSPVVTEGGCATNQVVATGAQPLSYQWQFNPTNVSNATNLPNATNATLILCGVTTNQAGMYQAIVTNPGGSVTSTPPGTLTVRPRPVNDYFANRIPLTGDQVSTTGSNRFGSSEPNEPAHAGDGPFATVWWSYTPPLRGYITVDLTGSFSGAVMAIYTGTNLNQLTLVPGNVSGAKVSFLGEAGTAYQIAVQGSLANSWGIIHLSITGDFPPTITSQPQDQAVDLGEDAAFSVTATSQSPLGYQWRFWDSDIQDETNQVLLLHNVSTNDFGQYSVRLTNDMWSVVSSNATLSVTNVLKGQITDATTGDPLPGVLVWAGSITNVSDINGNYRLVGVPATLRIDFDASVRLGPAPLSVSFSDLSSNNAVVLRAETNGYFAYTNNDVQIAQDQAVTNSFSMSPILPEGTMRLVLNWGAQPRDLDANLQTPEIDGQTYHVYYQTGSRGSLTNLLFAGLDHDSTNGFGPETITITEFFEGTYTYYVHKYAGIGNIAGSGATVKIYTETGLSQTVLAPTTGNGDFWMVCTIDGTTHEVTIVNQIQSTAPMSLGSGGGDYLKRDNHTTVGKNRPLNLPLGTATFAWDFGDGNKSTVEDPIHVYTNVGLYTVALTVTTSNNVVQTTTKTNFIQVLAPTSQPPNIVSQPTNQTVVVGATASFQVVAGGSGPLSYQWFFNRTNLLAGATNATLTLSNVQTNQAGYYAVAVANVAGSTNSTNASLTVLVVNQPPTFTLGTNIVVNENAGPQTNVAWATGISAGPPNESWQTLAFTVTTTNLGLFAVPPSLATNGTLTFTAATNAFGTNTVQVWLKDNGGTANGGQDTTGPSTFQIAVRWVNQAPTLGGLTNRTIWENAGEQTVNLSGISAGPANESWQALTVMASSSNPGLIANPAVTYTSPNTTGTLRFAPAANSNGVATITVTVKDNGGTANGGQDTTSRVFLVSVGAVNQRPTFTLGTNIVVNENGGAQTLANWATGISPGPANESTQTVAFKVTTTNLGLFAVPPALATNGTLTFTAATNAFGTNTVQVWLKDNGGTNNGGQDTTGPSTFQIAVRWVNQAPTLGGLTNRTISENAVEQTVPLSGISAGPANESWQTLTVTASSDNPGLIANPTVSYTSPNATGTLRFTPTVNGIGTAKITVTVKDSGGTANGGQDSTTNWFTITVNTVNRPPVLASIPPQTVTEGQLLTFTATATDPDVPPQKLTFTLGGNAPAGATIDPVSGVFRWTPPIGLGGSTQSVTVVVTDNGTPPLSDQANVSITVKVAPAIHLTQPANGALFIAGTDVLIVAQASDGQVPQEVDLFANGDLLTSAKFTPHTVGVLWTNVPAGTNQIMARAVYAGGAAATDQVQIVVVAVSNDVAVVHSQPPADNTELATITSTLDGMGLARGYDVLSLEDVSFTTLLAYNVIIWDDLAGQGLSSQQVVVLSNLFAAGRSLYFIGGSLTAASQLDPATWYPLIHLRPGTGSGGDGTVHLTTNNSITINLGHGEVYDFPLPPLTNAVQATGLPGEQIIGWSGDSDLLVAYRPSEVGQRSFTQIMPVVSGTDNYSLTERQNLFRNAVCWLLPGGCHCASGRLYFDTQWAPESALVGDYLTNVITLWTEAECHQFTDVTLIEQIPDGLRLLDVQPTNSVSWQTNGALLTCGLGTVAGTTTVSLIMVPLTANVFTNNLRIRTDQFTQDLQSNVTITVGCSGTLCAIMPPVITSQPTNKTVPVGGSASFQVVAEGTPPLGYQWFFKGTNMLDGATNASLYLSSITADQFGSYSVVVTNLAGTMPSQQAWLSPPEMRLSVVNFDARGLKLSLAGTPNQPYALESTPDLQHWTAVATNQNSTGVVAFPAIPFSKTNTFYRARTLP